MAVNLFCACVAAALLFVGRKQLVEWAEQMRDRFGGPPGPMGPLPSSDTHLLLKRRRKESGSL